MSPSPLSRSLPGMQHSVTGRKAEAGCVGPLNPQHGALGRGLKGGRASEMRRRGGRWTWGPLLPHLSGTQETKAARMRLLCGLWLWLSLLTVLQGQTSTPPPLPPPMQSFQGNQFQGEWFVLGLAGNSFRPEHRALLNPFTATFELSDAGGFEVWNAMTRGQHCDTWSYVLIPAAQPGQFTVDHGVGRSWLLPPGTLDQFICLGRAQGLSDDNIVFPDVTGNIAHLQACWAVGTGPAGMSLVDPRGAGPSVCPGSSAPACTQVSPGSWVPALNPGSEPPPAALGPLSRATSSHPGSPVLGHLLPPRVPCPGPPPPSGSPVPGHLLLPLPHQVPCPGPPPPTQVPCPRPPPPSGSPVPGHLLPPRVSCPGPPPPTPGPLSQATSFHPASPVPGHLLLPLPPQVPCPRPPPPSGSPVLGHLLPSPIPAHKELGLIPGGALDLSSLPWVAAPALLLREPRPPRPDSSCGRARSARAPPLPGGMPTVPL
nr:epididymal-specific lipocalin-12 isoform X2 [Pongo abelii]